MDPKANLEAVGTDINLLLPPEIERFLRFPARVLAVTATELPHLAVVKQACMFTIQGFTHCMKIKRMSDNHKILIRILLT